MIRDMQKAIQARKNKIPSVYCLTVGELGQLASKADNGQLCEALTDAFAYGYELACRAHRNKHVTKRDY